MLAELQIIKEYKKWDKHLLLNHPRLWALRLPTLLGYFVVFNFIGVLISLRIPLQPYNVIQFFPWLWLFGIVELIALGFWIRRFGWFSPEKALERTSPINGMFEIVIYMVCILIFLSPTIISSVALEIRFSQMIPLSELERDKSLEREIEYFDYYPQDLVEKYSRLDYETYLSLSGGDYWSELSQVDGDIYDVIYKLVNITRMEGWDWSTYLGVALLLTQISVLLFSARHTKKGLFGKTVVYGFGIILGFSILQGLLMSFIYGFFNYGYREIDRVIEIVLNLTMLILLGCVSFFSVRVYWQKGYKTFTAMNISILPYVVHVEILYWTIYFGTKVNFIETAFEKLVYLIEPLSQFWSGLLITTIIASPLLIAWVFIITKALYMQMLAQPEG